MINFPSVFQIFSKRLCSRLDSVLSTEENVILTNSLRDLDVKNLILRSRAGSRAAATTKTECFVIMIIIKRSILDVAAALDPPLKINIKSQWDQVLNNASSNIWLSCKLTRKLVISIFFFQILSVLEKYIRSVRKASYGHQRCNQDLQKHLRCRAFQQ